MEAIDSKDSNIPQQSSLPTFSPIVELRRYTLHSGQRDVLIELFEREFIESQEALGMQVIGQFRDLDNPDLFVWLRGFDDMPARAAGLQAFYGGPVWQAHRDVANPTMLDFSDVRLLRPARQASGFVLKPGGRAAPKTTVLPDGVVVATIYHLDIAASVGFTHFFESELRPVLEEAGASVIACFETEDGENNYPALPVREGEQVFVWFALYAGLTEYQRYLTALANARAETEGLWKALNQSFRKAPEAWRLAPTRRSWVHG